MPIFNVFNQPIQALVGPNDGCKAIIGTIQGNGSSSPTAGTGAFDRGMSATRDALGVYTITLPGVGSLELLGGFVQVEAVLLLEASISDRDDSARTIEVTVTDKATPTADDLESTDFLHFCFFVNHR